MWGACDIFRMLRLCMLCLYKKKIAIMQIASDTKLILTSFRNCGIFNLWLYGLSSFQEKDTKWDRFLTKNQHTQRKLLYFANTRSGHHFRKWTNLKIEVKIDSESQILALFESSLLIQNSKFNNFLWVCWFLCNNLSNFVPRLKTPQPVSP